MSVEEVCRKYNTDCVQVRQAGGQGWGWPWVPGWPGGVGVPGLLGGGSV